MSQNNSNDPFSLGKTALLANTTLGIEFYKKGKTNYF